MFLSLLISFSDAGVQERTGQITIKLNTSNPLINALLDKKVEPPTEPPAELAAESESSAQHNEWVTSSDVPDGASASLGATEVPVAGQISLDGVPTQNPLLLPDNAFSVPPPTLNPYMIAQPQIPQMAGVFSVPPPAAFQVPPPNVLPANHGAAGFARRPQSPIEADTAEKESTEETKKETRRKRDRKGAERDADDEGHKVSLFETLSSENVGRKCYIRQYAIRHKVTYEEAEKIVCYPFDLLLRCLLMFVQTRSFQLQEEECNFLSSKSRRSRKRRRSRSRGRRSRSRGRRSRSFEKEEDHNGVYTKGFAPLPKQKYAKNFEETDFAEDVVCAEPFDDDKEDAYSRPNYGDEGEGTRDEEYYNDQGYADSSYYEEAAGAPQSYEKAQYPGEDYGSHSRDGPERRRRKRGGKKHRAKRENERAAAFAERRRRR
ncbi:hypothetical protein OESDEN_05082 [Oesophagostomum dentatum]|uniref:Uncharacterized protein n=1 Tax=Oesophagostomum dentatum TaxID=61180 RepID=A0A0B1THT9_OESDE|nr:hypothetical protein OESDEN_05082 [Oesophagostomum dentatum]